MLWRLKALLRWLWEPWPVWLTTLLIAVSLYGSSQFAAWFSRPVDQLTDTLRYSGLILQVSGIATIAWGIRGKRKLFRRPSLAERAREWIKRFPDLLRKPEPINVSMSATISGVAGMSAAGVLLAGSNSLEDRVSRLEKRLKETEARLAGTEQRLHDEVTTLRDAAASEKAAREQADRAILTQLESFSVGELHIEAMGAVWVFVGIVLATIPAELAIVIDFFGRAARLR